MKSTCKGSLTYKRWVCALLLCALLLCAVSASAQSTWGSAYNPNGGAYVNLRLSGSYSGIIAKRISVGTPVEILKDTGEWLYVCVQGSTGYIHQNFVLSSALSTPNANATVATRNGGNLNLRADASLSSPALVSFASGTRVQVLTHGSLWCKVRVGAWVGYMKNEYLSFDGASASSGIAVVNNPKASEVLHLRKSPSQSSASLGQYKNGKQVSVEAVGSEWCRVLVDGQRGYMMTRYLTLHYAASSQRQVSHPQGSYVNLRSGQSYNDTVLQQVQSGTPVTILSPLGDWSRVRVGNQEGYMVSSFLK